MYIVNRLVRRLEVKPINRRGLTRAGVCVRVHKFVRRDAYAACTYPRPRAQCVHAARLTVSKWNSVRNSVAVRRNCFNLATLVVPFSRVRDGAVKSRLSIYSKICTLYFQ